VVGAACSSAEAAITIQSAERSLYWNGVEFWEGTQSFSGTGNWSFQTEKFGTLEIFPPPVDPMMPPSGTAHISSYVNIDFASAISQKGFSWSDRRDVSAGGDPFVPGFARADVNLEVTFTLDAPNPFDFLAWMGPSMDPSGGYSNYVFQLQRGTEEVFKVDTSDFEPGASVDYSKSGVLDPGVYHFSAQGSAWASSWDSAVAIANSTFALDLESDTPAVPEPASLVVWGLLAATCLGGVVWRRKRPA
jgi:hypothetical protein